MITFNAGEIISDSAAATEAIAGELVKLLPDGGVVALHGDLGAGKTVFCRGIARALGISEAITSPTFNLVLEYTAGTMPLYHMDLYRINGSDDALACGIDDYLGESGAICVIEWAERIADILPSDAVKISIRHVSPEVRTIRIEQRT